MSCPHCGAETVPDQGFCTKCGAALVAVQAAPSVTAALPAQAVSASVPAHAAPLPPSAGLHPIPEGGFTIEDIVAWLQNDGYSAKVVPYGDGDSRIMSNMQGTACNIFLNDLKDGRYQSIGFGVGFSTNGKFDVKNLNVWNTNNRWTRAYYDEVNDPWLVMDVDLWPGGTYESLRDQFAAWNNTLARFIQKFDLK